MGKIRLLPDRVANQIAAGEVVERPAAVVKELVENSLDAGARRIEVTFSHGGRSLMSVEDDGHGMGPSDARLSLERHATSKIAEADDLNRLSSFGFRGEALPSIASVSRFTLQTREEGSDAGTEILVNAGSVVHERQCGRPVGTRISVEQLFNSVPARRKFLKTDQTEAAHIVGCVRLYALGCPQTAFTLVEDGKVIFRSPECSSLRDRVSEIFGRSLAQALLDIDISEQGLRLWGLIGKPGTSRSSRHELVIFVNGRPIENKGLTYALSESYRDSLPEGRYPVAFLFLEMDPGSVDVNVHPAKREVRFRNEALVRSIIVRSVLAKLREASHPEGEPTSVGEIISLSDLSATPALGAREASPAWPSDPVTPRSDPPARKAFSLAWTYLGLAHGSFALFETAAGLVLLDRRAAHERVWYERLKNQVDSGGGSSSQRLLLPLSIELDPVLSVLLVEVRSYLHVQGFEISDFGRNFFRIEAVPAWMEPGDAIGFVRDLLGEVREGRWSPDSPSRNEEFAKLAAARAVRLPATVTETEVVQLATELLSSASPLTSPSGKATYVELSHSELSRRFQK